MTGTLLRGGRVYAPVDPPATALLVQDGTIAWVGADADAADTATFAVWAAGPLGPEGLPELAPGVPAPTCLRTVVRGETIHPQGMSEVDR